MATVPGRRLVALVRHTRNRLTAPAVGYCNDGQVDYPTQRIAVTRRGFLVGGTAAAALAVSGCGVFGTSKPRTVTKTAPPPVDPMAALIAMTRLHVARLQAAVALGAPALADKLPLVTTLHADRVAHLTAMEAELARSSGGSTAAVSPSEQPAVSIGKEAAAVLTVIAEDAGTAQVAYLDQVPMAPRYRAAMFASIAAALATHRAVLG